MSSEIVYVTRAEAARMLGVSLSTIKRMISDGRLSATTATRRTGQRGPILRVSLVSVQQQQNARKS